jgi:hypothetical protein
MDRADAPSAQRVPVDFKGAPPASVYRALLRMDRAETPRD